MLSQIVAVTGVNIRSMRQRLGSSAVAIVGIAGVVLVFVAVLSIAEGVATGGMEAKLNAAVSALRPGVGQVRIAPGAAPEALSRVLAGEQLGTRLVS